MLLRARTLLPAPGSPVADGALWIERGEIVRVGAWDELRTVAPGPVHDLGEALVIPGLVNAHCHLEYTALAGRLPPPKSFADWIKSLSSARQGATREESLASWRAGAAQALAGGATTVVNNESTPAILPSALGCTPLRLASYLEATCLGVRRSAGEALAGPLAAAEHLAPQARIPPGLAPHAPYSTNAELLGLAARAARRHGWRISVHIAESQAEFDMFMYRRGPLFDWLAPQRGMEDCGAGSPVRHCAAAGLFEAPCLAAHVNYLWEGDAEILGRARVAVVHCPRSHAYFRHHRFPREELVAAGVRLCLGTDSLASTRRGPGPAPTLSMFEEMAALAAADSWISPAEILTMATLNPAAALGLEGRLGVLAPGALADLVVLRAAPAPEAAAEAVVHHQGPVAGVMIGGVWVGGTDHPAGA